MKMTVLHRTALAKVNYAVQ